MRRKTFRTDEFLQFAKTVENRDWETLAQKKPYRFSVEFKGIRLMPSTGQERYISYSEIKKFCELFSKTQSYKTLTYHAQFNKSYLLPIVKQFEISTIKIMPAEEVDPSQSYVEGAVKTISVNAYERNAAARQACVEHYGVDCFLCGFNFGERYGEFADGFIHIHHISPVSAMEGEKSIDPIRDLRPVCPNCHAIIHMRNGCLTLEEASALINPYI